MGTSLVICDSKVFATSKLILQLFWVMKRCNIVGKTDVSGYAFDPILSRDNNLKMGSKSYPETSYLFYITPRHNPKELQHLWVV